MNSTKIVPLGKDTTAKVLQGHAAKTQDTLVDAVGHAEVAGIKRAVFRAPTRLRAATIKEFDTIARSVTQAIEAHYEDTKDIQGLSNSNTFISLEHLCSMVRDVSVERTTDCTHAACITRTFIEEYRKHKQVEVFQHGTAGQSLRAATRDDEIQRVRRFLVKKRNRQGQAQLRYVSVIDVYGLLGGVWCAQL